jgi:hypothetical protein
MKRYFFYFCLLINFVLLGQAQAQITQNLRGRVIDKETQTPLVGVSVFVVDNQKGVQSNAEGRFLLKDLPLGRYNLLLTMIGYTNINLSNIELGSGKEVILNIEMIETPQFLNEVIVKADLSKEKPINDLVMVSGRQFTTQEGNRYAGGYGDAARMAMSFAGVTSAGNDQNNEIIIRGNSPKGLLWRLEGIEIPNPNHFGDGQGSTSGIISMINSSSLANSDFLTGAFPAEYGNAMSGVFDLRLRKGNDQKHEKAIQLGIIGLEASAEGPLNKTGASYRFNARYSTLELLLKSGLLNIETGGFQPEYRDMNFSLNFPTQKVGTFSAFGVGGMSFSSDKETTYEKIAQNGMGVVGLSHKISVNKKGYFYSVLAYTKEANFEEDKSLINNLFVQTFDMQYSQNNLRLSSFYNHKFSNRSSLRIGTTISQLAYSFRDNRWDNTRKVLVNFLNENDKTYFIQHYAQFKYNLSPSISFTAGIHYNRFALNNNQTTEPRAGVSWQVSQKQSIGIGYGMHSRLEPISMYLFKRRKPDNTLAQPNLELGLSRSNHFIISYDRSIGKNTHLKIELYDQWLYNIPVDTNRNSSFSMVNSSGGLTNTVLVNEGVGKNQGVELTFEKYFSDNYYFLFTSSIFKTQYKSRQDIWRNTIFDNGYALSLLGGRDFSVGKSKVHWLILNGRFMLRGGNRYTPIILSESIKKGNTVQDVNQILAIRYPDYWRFDLGIGYRINKKRATWTISGDFQNVTNHQNIIREFYSNTTKTIRYNYALPIVPILNFKVDF